MALLWWAILLLRHNQEIFNLKIELLKEQQQNILGISEIDIVDLEHYPALMDTLKREKNMIVGEGVVFGITLIIGIFLIYNASKRVLLASEKQKNFLLSITHELKSPLASIILILSTFVKRKLPYDTIKELSNDGLGESIRLEELFNKILTATRIDKAYEFNFELVDFSSFLNNLVTSFQKLYPDGKISLNIEPNINLKIDKEGMVSVIKNLLENAYKYSPNSKEINVSLNSESDKIIMTFSDHGIGIPKEERKKVFEQFYRIGNEDTRESKGTGLGLYITKKVILAHGGKIEIKESDSGGTKVVISL